MERLPRWLRRLVLFVRRDAVERAMDAELRHHLDCEIAQRIAAGASAAEARRTALRDFGGVEQIKEAGRDARGVRPAEDLLADTKYGARVLRRNFGFTVAAVLTFALGCGASSAIFSVVYGVLLRPLQYLDPERLTVLWETNESTRSDHNVVSVANFEAWRERSRSFAGMAALVPKPVTVANREGPERLMGAEVSPGYFSMLGVAPALGRDFVPADGLANGAPAVILSDGMWHSRYGGDPRVVGRSLAISGTSYLIVGVMPASFDPPRIAWLGDQELWLPFKDTPEHRSWGRFLLVVARLKAGVPFAQARLELAAVAKQLSREAKDDEGWSTAVIPLREQISGEVRTPLLVVLSAVVLLLIIAVVNVATLSDSLMRRRHDELATRRTLGATEGRLFRQLLTQSALVGLLGAGIALLAVSPLVRLLLWLAPPSLPRLTSIRVDAPVFIATVAAAVLSTLVFGTLAAPRTRRDPDLVSSAGNERSTHRRAARGLVVSEIAVALALAIMATLMARSFAGLRAVNLGFQSAGVLTAWVTEGATTSNTDEQSRLFFAALLERVRALPGVTGVSTINTRPFGGMGPATEVRDSHPRLAARRDPLVADVRYVGGSYFATLRIPFLRGRTFDAHEPIEGAPRTVLSASLAAVLWPGEDPLGHRVHLDLYNGIDAEVIGVVPDQHLMDARTPARSAAFLSDLRFPSVTRDLVVRAGNAPQTIVPVLRRVTTALDPGATLFRIATLPSMVDESLAADRFTTLLLGGFAALALVLSAVGVFGVIAGETTERRREIGIRMALGATRGGVAGTVLGDALGRAALGVVAGLLLGAAVAQAMKGLLFGVAPTDPVTFLTMSAAVLAVVIVATLIPTVRAIASAPLRALRDG